MTYKSHMVLIMCILIIMIDACSCSFRPTDAVAFSTLGTRHGSFNKQIDSKQLDGSSSVPIEQEKDPIIIRRQGVLWVIPVLASILAFLSFKTVSHGFHAIVKAVSHDTWVPSSEAELNLQTEVITQVVNGPVITSISVLFATLVSTTISFLHDRQLKMKSLFTEQMDELQILRLMLAQMPEPLRNDAILLTQQYTKCLLQNNEGQVNPTDARDASLFSLLQLLQVEMTLKRPSPIATMAFECVTRIQQAQSNRRTVLQTKFPAMHYTTMWTLALGICLSFLVATDSSLLIFESLQVRILWTILIGAFTSLAVVCYDLSSPFVGAYQVSVLCCAHTECAKEHNNTYLCSLLCIRLFLSQDPSSIRNTIWSRQWRF